MNARDRKIRQMMLQGLSRKQAESKVDERLSRDNAQAIQNRELVKDRLFYSKEFNNWVTIPE